MVNAAWPARSRAQTAAVAASAAAHALAFLFLVWRLGASPELPDTPVINVELTPPRRVRQPPPTGHEAPSPSPSATAARAQDAVLPPTPEAVVIPPAAAGDGVRQALRGLMGCEHAALVALTAQERERCRERAMTEAGRLRDLRAPRLDLSQRGRFAEEAVPYLARKPKNGCKLMAGGDTAPSGDQGAVAGIGCAWSF